MSKLSPADAFMALHRARPGFIMPNAWDAGSAIVLASCGYRAIATTSAGIAFSLGKPDYTPSEARFGVTRDAMFARMREIVAAVDVPVNGDLEAGYGERPEDVAETVRMAIDIGLAGGNIEDKRPHANELYDEERAVERIIAAREAIDAAKSSFVLTARTDALFWLREDAFETCVRRARRFHEAGAHCLFIPGAVDKTAIARLVREIPAPLNLVFGLAGDAGNPREWIGMGVQRVSVGASIARATLAFVRDCAQQLALDGAIPYASKQATHSDLNRLFERRA